MAPISKQCICLQLQRVTRHNDPLASCPTAWLHFCASGTLALELNTVPEAVWVELISTVTL